jgi:glycosyltransferase involved in cell wall biosynthesis
MSGEKALPISAIVCTLNEAMNIEECLAAISRNRPAETIVVDASSSDNTVERAAHYGAVCRVCERRGLAFQRQLGVSLAKEPYLAFVDADDVLDKDCLDKLLGELQEHGYSAIQALSRSYALDSYWERAMDSLGQMQAQKPGASNMVGRPALYRTDILVRIGLDPNWGPVGNEDTDLSIRYEREGQHMGIGRGTSRRKHPGTFHGWVKKWKKYGKGDLLLLRKYPEKTWAILHHQLIGYPVRRSIEGIRNGYGRYCPFYIMFGLFRFFFMVKAGILGA